MDGQQHDTSGQELKSANTLLSSFGYAAQGVKAVSSERNFRVDCVFAVVAIVLNIVLAVPAWGWAAVCICIAVQLGMEAVNTAVEAVVDLASPDIHPLAKRAKDTAAGAALITAIGAVVIACIVYIPAFMALVGA
jgi:diacylglycerol kinase